MRISRDWAGVVTAAALVLAMAASCGRAGPYYPPPDSEGGWRTLLTAQEIEDVAGMDSAKLDQAFEFIQRNTRNGGLLVLRHGWLVYERYFGLGHREALPNLASCGKSFTSISVGILMHERPDLFPQGLDQKIFTPEYFPPEAFPLADPAMSEIKLGQLLAFSAGVRGNNPSYVNRREIVIGPVGPDGWPGMVDEIALGRDDGLNQGGPATAASLWCAPGAGYSYATASIHLASIMLRHIAGMELETFVRQRVAEPLGWGRFGWGYKNRERVTHTPGGGGIAPRATDMLRFGYLLLREGRWADAQVVPREYVQHCSRVSPYNPHYPYSLQFNVNSEGDVPALPRDAFWKSGSGGHVLYMVPSLDLVVWKLGGRDEQYDPAQTGLETDPRAQQETAPRPDWQAAEQDDFAAIETLAMVISAVRSR
jgi:CubicO group peptidase (beta-lactamase class C family)